VRQSLDGLNEYLKVQAAQQALSPASSTSNEVAKTDTPTPATPAYKPLSQTSLALKVARDVLGDFIPVKYQPWALGAVVVVLLLIVWLVSR
jgi:hypothetical protein